MENGNDVRLTSEMVDELIAQCEKIRKKQERSMDRELPVPRLLYHASLRKLRGTIQTNGLKPSKLIFSSEEVVCLADDPEFAVRVVCKQHNVEPEKIDVWMVDTAEMKRRDLASVKEIGKQLIENFLRKEDLREEKPIDREACHEVWYREKIEPEWIALDDKEK